MSHQRHNTAIVTVFALLTAIYPITLQAQTTPRDRFLSTADSSDLMLCIDGQGFFVNNEHAGSSRVNGYTLPGFYLRPYLKWHFDKKAELQMGVHWLHFWGNPSDNDANGMGLVASVTDSLTPRTIVPWLRMRYNPIPEVSIIMGSLVNNNGHNLPLPLYNPERAFAVSPEAGLQVMTQTSWLTFDCWIDWQHFIWNRSTEREIFVLGASAEPSFNIGESRMHLPMHFLAQHLGGENRADTHLDVETYGNAAMGIGVSHNWGEMRMRIDGMVMFYSRTGPPENEPVYVSGWEDWWYMISPRRNFKRGLGLYPRLTVQWKGLWMESSYWVSEGFVPLLGCYHYSNTSGTTSNMTHDRIQVTALRASWTWSQNSRYAMRLYGAWFHYFPFTADRTGYAKVHGKAADMFSMGLQLSFTPHLSLQH